MNLVSILAATVVTVAALVLPFLLRPGPLGERVSIPMWAPEKGWHCIAAPRWVPMVLSACCIGVFAFAANAATVAANRADQARLRQDLRGLQQDFRELEQDEAAEKRLRHASQERALLAEAAQEELKRTEAALTQELEQADVAQRELQSDIGELRLAGEATQQIARDLGPQVRALKAALEQAQLEHTERLTALLTGQQTLEGLMDSAPPPTLHAVTGPDAEDILPPYEWVGSMIGGEVFGGAVTISMDRTSVKGSAQTPVSLVVVSWNLGFSGILQGRRSGSPTATFHISKGQWKGHELRVTPPTSKAAGTWTLFLRGDPSQTLRQVATGDVIAPLGD